MAPMINQDAWPDSITDPEVRKLLETFYELSNAANSASDTDTNEKAFADLFDPEKGVYQLASRKAEGRDGKCYHCENPQCIYIYVYVCLPRD